MWGRSREEFGRGAEQIQFCRSGVGDRNRISLVIASQPISKGVEMGKPAILFSRSSGAIKSIVSPTM